MLGSIARHLAHDNPENNPVQKFGLEIERMVIPFLEEHVGTTDYGVIFQRALEAEKRKEP
jgi:hypothetical protein